MILRLSLQNIHLKKFRTFLVTLSIIISTASLILFLGLSSGIKNASFEELEKKNPLTQVIVRPNIEETGLLSFISSTEEGAITQQTLEAIKKIDNVIAAYPEIQYNNFASLEASLLGFSLITDTMVFGLEKDFVADDISKETEWNQKDQPYPALIPRKLLDLYNMAIAYPQGIPTISEDTLLGKSLTLYPSYSTFFPEYGNRSTKIELEIVGFSDKINLLGVTLSYPIVENLNLQYASPSSKYLEIFVEASSASQTPIIAKEIEEMGLSTQYFQKNVQEVQARTAYLSISLGTISLIILAMAAIAIMSTFLATVAERTRQLGLYRALGATKFQIKKLIILEAGFLGLIGSIFGVIIGIIMSTYIDKIALRQLETAAFTPETIFNIDLPLIITVTLFGVALAVISSYIPAQKASNINPIKALKF